MGMIEDLSRTLDTEDGVRRLTGARNLPAVQAPMYNPESVPRIAGPGANLPAVQAPLYTPESAPRLAAPATEAPAAGPIARAAGLAGGAGALLAGGAAATGAATGTVAANPDYFKSSIGDDGLAANILSAGQAPQTIADVAKSQPVTARTQNGPLSVPTIAQMASGDSTAGAGRGSVNPPGAIAALMPQYDDTYRQQNLTNNLNQAYREGDPIGQIIQQRMGQQGGQGAGQAPVNSGGIIGGGDTVYSPGMAPQRDPYQTADGRSLNPNDANLSADDRSAIGQYQARNAQMLADMQREQQGNPLAGAVQMIRPGSDVSYAVQAPGRMVEMAAPAFAQYQSAFQKNPDMAGRAQMTEAGMTVDGLATPANVIGHGDATMKAYQANAAKDAATGLDAGTLAKIAEQEAKNKGALDVANAQAMHAKVPPGYRPTTTGNLEAVPGGPADQKLQGAFNADTAALTGANASMDRLAVAANEVLKHPGLESITGWRGKIPNFPGSDAANAQALLNTLKSQVGFGVLQDMRNNSKTGGALGGVSNEEGKRLEANLAALEKEQSPEQMKESLQKILEYSAGAKDRLLSAYNLRHGNAGDSVQRSSVATPATQPGTAAPANAGKPATAGGTAPSASAQPAPIFQHQGAQDIRAQYAAGKLTRDQAAAALSKMGFK